LKLPDRLLTAVLFWNLVTNIAYFALATIVTAKLQRESPGATASVFAVLSFLIFTFVAETLPKSLAVLRPRLIAALVAVPMAVAVRILDPVLAFSRIVLLLSQRLVWPKFAAEPYLQLSDLERAVELSTTDTSLLEQERTVLQNIVALSEVRVEEVMRPRMRFRSFRPPVSLSDLEGHVPAGGYVLVTEAETDEVAAAIPLENAVDLPHLHLERWAESVVYVPWCSTAGETLDLLRNRELSVAVVVNELGETIGIVTLDDILDTVFRPDASRSRRLLKRNPIEPVEDGVWRVTGMTTLRRLAKEFNQELPPTTAVTVAGVIQDVLHRLPLPGDRCRFGPFAFEVLGTPDHGHLMVRMTMAPKLVENGGER
jgi:Mg2+/Co2+ transporter CorB